MHEPRFNLPDGPERAGWYHVTLLHTTRGGDDIKTETLHGASAMAAIDEAWDRVGDRMPSGSTWRLVEATAEFLGEERTVTYAARGDDAPATPDSNVPEPIAAALGRWGDARVNHAMLAQSAFVAVNGATYQAAVTELRDAFEALRAAIAAALTGERDRAIEVTLGAIDTAVEWAQKIDPEWFASVDIRRGEDAPWEAVACPCGSGYRGEGDTPSRALLNTLGSRVNARLRAAIGPKGLP